MPARMLINPGLYRAEHVLLDLNVSAAKGWVVECAQYVVGDFIYGDIGVLPCIEDTRDSILKNRACNTARARVKYVGKMIL